MTCKAEKMLQNKAHIIVYFVMVLSFILSLIFFYGLLYRIPGMICFITVSDVIWNYTLWLNIIVIVVGSFILAKLSNIYIESISLARLSIILIIFLHVILAFLVLGIKFKVAIRHNALSDFMLVVSFIVLWFLACTSVIPPYN